MCAFGSSLVLGYGSFHFDLNQITEPPESANHENSLPAWEKRHVKRCGLPSRRCCWTRSNFFLRVVVISAGRLRWPQFVLNARTRIRAHAAVQRNATLITCRAGAELLSKDEARRIAANIAKLPELTKNQLTVGEPIQVPHDAGTPARGFISGWSRCRLL